jgi:hypothetical protein
MIRRLRETGDAINELHRLREIPELICAREHVSAARPARKTSQLTLYRDV